MRQYEAYSVLITDEKGKRGTGTLFYAENAASFYVLTCAHVIYTSHQINIQILIPAAGGPKEESIVVSRDHFRCTFNDPDQMLDDVKILLDEGLYTEADYNEKCLIINMLNCRPVQAEQYAGWAHGMHPLLSSKYERMLLVWKGAQVMPNTHWNSMQQWIASQMFDVYKKEKWLRNPKDILFESCTSENKAIVVDLWTLYFFVKVQAQEVMSHFKTIYITYDTVSMALQEINQVNDDDIRRVLIHLQREGNVKLLSPTLEQQLTVRNPSYNFMEVHSACLLAQELNCPAFVGEFRFEIPEQLRSKVIRPDNLKEVMDCVMDKKLLEAE